ncbi:MAG: GGDEF domain-containing protein [Gammaproteobacteria bacterium]|nr:GGDEF domain-containing protein [Gammaproteobacteria bacterium]
MLGGEVPVRGDAGAAKVLRLLDALRESEAGRLIHGQVERMLSEVVDRQVAMEEAYLAVTQALLDAYAQHLSDGSSEKVQLKLLQARLQPPLTESELRAVSAAVVEYGGRIESLSEVDTGLFRDAVAPLLRAFGIQAPTSAPVVEEKTPVANGAEPESMSTSAESRGEVPAAAVTEEEVPAAVPPEETESPHLEAGWEENLDAALSSDPRVDLSDPLQGSVPSHHQPMEPVERRVDSVYRTHLDSKRRDIQKLQSTLAQRVLETITQNEEFGVLLEVVLGELHQVSDAEELEELRWTLIREIEKLNRGHHELADKLDSTHHYLQLIESDSRQLSDELTRVRLLSLTDELTGLPNRRAFLRRLEDEVARVQRYGFPLSLALIDLDYFKQINDRYGHAAGDEVLSLYSKNILSIFRHHDLVARYGGEEFAVLLPNTDADGSRRALTKVKKRAAETSWSVDDKVMPVPTFSAGVSLYKPGETVGSFIDRADKALYRAKRLGRNRVELDSTYTAEAGNPEEKSAESGPETAQGAEES